MFFDIFTILPLTCSIFVTFLGIFILVKDPKSRMNQLLFGFNVCMFFWLFGTFMMFATRGSVAQAIFWDRFVYLGVVLMPALMHHFSLVFTNQEHKQTLLLTINYLVGIFFVVVSRTPYFVDGLYIYSWGAHTQARLFHHIFLATFFLGTGIFFVNLLKSFLKSKDRIYRTQIIYVFIAFALVMFVGGSAYLYAYGIDTKFPFAYVTGLLFPVMLFYAVMKHGLLGIKSIATEVLVGVAEFFIVIQIFFSETQLEIIERIMFATVLGLIGFLLARSVNREIIRRQETAKLAKSLEQANLQLKELDKQKTDFLSIAAHQLRTPLSIINGYVELINDGAYGKVTQKVKTVLTTMDESNVRLVKLVDEFLDITRIEQGKTKFDFKEKEMCAVVESVVNEFEDRVKKSGLKLTWIACRDKIVVVMDEEKIRHVIFNFVDNAIKYSAKGTVTVSVNEENNGVAVRVRDQGFGFNKTDEANFFQKFYRGNNVKGTNVTGTGLGLYVCRKFIEAHEGKIWAHSEGLKKGSEFGLWIPFKEAPAA